MQFSRRTAVCTNVVLTCTYVHFVSLDVACSDSVFPEDGCMTVIMNDYDDDYYYDGYDCGNDHNDGDYDDDSVDDGRDNKEAMTMTMMATMPTMVATDIHKNIIISHKTIIKHQITILEISLKQHTKIIRQS